MIKRFNLRNMSIVRSFLLIAILTLAGSSFAQTSGYHPFLKIGDETVMLSDFEYAYKKNLLNNADKPEPLDDFLQSYINLKIKIAEAKDKGLDKSDIFLNEYNNYARTARSPFVSDTISPAIVAKTTYDRLQEDVEVSQVFIPFGVEKVFPKDTLDTFLKITQVRQKMADASKEEYASLVKQYPVPQTNSNNSITSWQTALMSSEILENAIYNTPIGTISQPVRTNEGYYLIKVHQKRASRGEVKISHIIFPFPDNATPTQKDSVRALSQRVVNDLDKGVSFEGLAKVISFDRATAEVGGNLDWFSTRSNLLPTFDSIFFSLKEVGNYTRPIEFNYGIQIFKLTAKSKLDPWPGIKNDLIKELEEKKYTTEIEKLKLKRLSDQYSYSLNNETYQQLLNIANTTHVSDSTFFHELAPIEQLPLIQTRDKQLLVSDLLLFIVQYPQTRYSLSTDILEEKKNELILNQLFTMLEEDVIKNNPELRYQLQEYHDGILLFDIMEQEVWAKARDDDKGLAKTFKRNRSKYTWADPKYKGYVIHVKDKDTFDEALEFQKKKGKDKDFIQQLLITFNTDSVKPLYVEKGAWGKGENSFVDHILYETEVKKEIVGYPYFFINGKMIKRPETFEDVRGLVVQDYQNQLEQEWTKNIRKKYQVTIDPEILQNLKQKYNQ
ncbi:foldase protein PrsA [Dysgonomonas macrotermitis]|uniref:peptidylprolyl isomerase n=2 Tax=Dysgonomonas macrotermitis TaxID=1346286 RepID=A0A1M4TS08_9BACT|nr:peptidylprolyl isomerase [Dysgonomonas macrotermitis]SHE47175.1 peptidyl-prolyl cis-trans isomerase SurA [Dysgonomonas macrotermitis]